MAAWMAIPAFTNADVKLPSLFSDHMVLQRDIKIPVWGWADPGEQVTVEFANKTATTKAGAGGDWRVDLDKVAVNAKPQTLTVKGRNTITLQDVLVGDVWVCSGQSNMEFYLGETYNASKDVPAASDPLLRLFRAAGKTSIKPEKDIELWNKRLWLPCTPEEAKAFTAVGYFFGRDLRKALNIPIGLISSSQGGSKAQLWLSPEAIEKNVGADPEFKDWLAKRRLAVDSFPQKQAEYLPLKEKFDQNLKRWFNEVNNAPEFVAKMKAWEVENNKARADGKPPLPRPEPSQPRPKAPEPPDGGPYSSFMVGALYNAMIAPLIPYAIKGVIWYQGESNTDNGKQYRVLFPLLIEDWRAKWGQGNFPFLFVQLPNMNKLATEPAPGKDRWPVLREAQAMALSLPNTGMAVTIDVGDPYNVHGKDKSDVGARLALVAGRVAYGANIVYTGPTYDSMKLDGDKVRIAFKNTGHGLEIGTPPWTPSGKIPPVANELKGFAIAGEDRNWVWAKAQIEGNVVIVSSDHVAHPAAVRYGWADNPPCNLYNKEKLPAAPFRTDTWEP